MTKLKMYDLADLPKILSPRRQNLVVHAHGVFDILHIGHIRHFKQGAKLGGTLVVTLTADEFVRKGAGRPVFPASLRAEAVASLECVDLVAINPHPTSVEAIRLIEPHFYIKGSQYRNNLTDALREEWIAVREAGGSLRFTDDPVVSSSTEVLRKVLATT